MSTLTPLGRRGSAVVLLATAIVLLIVAPAAAAAGLSLTPAQRTVTSSTLTVVPSGGGTEGGVTLAVTDAGGRAAAFRLGPAASGRALSVDLSAPHSGSAPRNGRATVTLSDSTGVLAQTQVTIDRTPPAAPVSAAAEGSRIRVSWSKVAWPDAVTYRLQRSAGGAAQVVYEGPSAGFTDRDVAAGRVTYTLTAGAPGGGGGTNWSPATTTSTRISAAAVPSAAPAQAAAAVRPSTAGKASPAKPARGGAGRPQHKPRRVQATGAVRGVVDDTDPVPTVGHASAPWVDGSAGAPHVVAVPPPVVAAPRDAVNARDRIPNPFPVTVLPPATIAVQTMPSLPVAGAAGLLLLGLAAAAVLRWWRQRRELQRLVVALARRD